MKGECVSVAVSLLAELKCEWGVVLMLTCSFPKSKRAAELNLLSRQWWCKRKQLPGAPGALRKRSGGVFIFCGAPGSSSEWLFFTASLYLS